jgi:hypothetical protein
VNETPVPQGWERVDADPAQAELHDALHPELTFQATERLYVGASEGTTGAIFADAGDELEVRSLGNNVARVTHVVDGTTALVQLSQLAGKVRPTPGLE